MNTKTLQEEKADIKKALRHPFSEGAIWQPLAIPWFEKWKTYVNYDDEVPEPRAKELIDSLHPGEIDNNGLQGSFGDEMRRDAVEGRDYVLMPTSYVNKLFEKYGGGPSYPRKVLNVGATYNPIFQVNLFPVRIEVYFCDKHQPLPVQTDERFKRRYFNKNMSLENVAEDLHRIFQVSSATSSIRYWLRDTPPDVSGRNKEGRGRMLTCDVVDFDNDWRFVRSDKHRNIQEVLGDRDCIELIIESTMFRSPRDSDWPRFQQLEAWKETLQVGDMVDVRDRKGKFYAAKILSVDENRNLQVHFFGWAENSDERILSTEINTRVQPLHSHSFDRTTWEEGNKLDVCLTEVNQQAVWVTGTIISVDPLNDRIEVLVDAKDKADALKKVSSTAAAEVTTATATSTSLYDDIDDDDFAGDDEKKKKTTTLTTSSSFVSVATIAAAVEDVTTAPPQEDVSLRTWHDVYADTIAPQYTHTPAVRTYNTSSSYGYSSGYTMSLYNGYGSGSSSSYDRHTKGTPPVAGAIGLQNLGNTCFMNSILQCLSNTQGLTEIFTTNVYKDQINYDNPLGHAGKIALTYGKLMKDVWSGAYTKIVPREFKTVIGEYRPQFAGYEQQDSQEMMSCLLDGLHEDLNRIYKKPYTQKIESKGRPDELIASEAWRRFLLRNDSLIVEKFFGLQKSHVTCKKCGKESVTFDPYAALSLPIPIRNTRTIHVVVQLLPHYSAPVRVALEVELTAPMSELKKILLDKLFALNLLTKPEDKVVGPLSSQLLPSNNNTSHNDSSNSNSNSNSVSSKQSTEESFELVDRKDAAIEATDDNNNNNHSNGDYHMVVEGEEGPVSNDLSSNKSKNTNNKNTKPKTVYDAFHFHFGMLHGTRPSTVFKNYNTAEARNTAIQAYVNKLYTLIAFQLEHDLPEFKPMASQSYYSSSNTYNSTRNYNKKLEDIDDAEAEGEESNAIFGFDLSVGIRTVETRLGTATERTELASYPHRLSFPQGDATTNAEVHRVVREVLSRFVPADSLLRAEDALAHWPYELVVTTAYGTTAQRTIRDNDDPFQPLKENSSEILVAYFHPSAEKDRLVDLSKVRELVDSETMRGGVDEEAMDSNTSGVDEEEDTLDDDVYYPATTYQQQVQKKNKSSGVTNNLTTNKKVKRGISIYDCLDKFVEREQLADTETVYCSQCKDMLAPIKKMDIWTAPDVLLLHLKRFQFLTGQYMVLREKITEVVDFPIEGLDLSRYVQGPVSPEAPPIYDLYAVSHHMGGLGGGHYTATAKNFLNNQWYNFNDSSVSPADPASAVTATAYVLFYKRRTGALKWAGAVPHPVGLPDEADD